MTTALFISCGAFLFLTIVIDKPSTVRSWGRCPSLHLRQFYQQLGVPHTVSVFTADMRGKCPSRQMWVVTSYFIALLYRTNHCWTTDVKVAVLNWSCSGEKTGKMKIGLILGW
jgi:hypothetical protein